ncbi:histone-lysine N-methyltransferase SETD1B [Musca vetustissima]|uniref:histone-lysine N-methyltransferase SETD1B n=1 Tax=Musca vetustissima TaxID=27455 RepID=UPI002AB7A838|nr:histone-lysine N-methyltransferase SETD1B [Musca vetustissima]
MSCKLSLAIFAVICFAVSIEAASVGVPVIKGIENVVHKLDYEGVQANVRGSRQAYEEDVSGEDSDEDDDEDDAERVQQNIIQQQQAQEQAHNDSQEGSDEDDEEDDEEEDDDDDSSFFGRRRRRDVAEEEADVESVAANEIVESEKPEEDGVKEESAAPAAPAPSPAPSSSNTNVLILIRDAIKKVTTELPNSQQVATSAQQYFQLFGHFLQQTIEQVIGDDDDEDEVEATTVIPEAEEVATVVETDKESSTKDKETAVTAEKESESVENKPVTTADQTPAQTEEAKA